MAISKKAWTGVALETTAGTGISSPTLYIPTKATFENQRKPVYLNEDRGTRDKNYGVVDTIKQATGSLKGTWFNDSATYLLLGMFGAPTSTQPNSGTDPTVYSHAFALADIPKSLTLFKSYDAAAYSFAYSVVSKLSFMIADQDALFTYDASTMSKWGTKIGSPPTPTWTSVPGMPGVKGTVTIGGSANADVKDLKIDLTQVVTPWFGISGSQDVQKFYFGEREAKIELTARFDADTYYNHFFTSTAAPTIESIQIDVFGPVISHAYTQQFTMNFPLVNYDTAVLDESATNVLVKFKGTAMPGTSANSLATAIVVNTVTAYTS